VNNKDTQSSKPVNPPAQPAPGTKKSSRWLKIALIASLMLNALFIGAIGMRFYHYKQSGGWEHGRHGPSPRLGMGRFFRELPRERRKELRTQFSEMRREMRGDHSATKQAIVNVVAILRAEKLDSENLAAAFSNLSDVRGANAKRNEEYLLAVVKTLSVEERKAMAEAMTRRRDRREERRKRRKHRKENQD
jgi:uncharacterized membrane protein